MRNGLIVSVSGGLILGGSFLGYYMGKHYNEPTSITNLNVNPKGPAVIAVYNNNCVPPKQKVFVELKRGEFVSVEEYRKIEAEEIREHPERYPIIKIKIPREVQK
ncbi:hypothetical protein HYT23_02135 [Candidatus Pacearchaeota archaeon]|nr:hypothetical protein [Candidatus Pacearchaeota archaeon]